MGSQRVRHDWVTEHTWIVDLLCCVSFSCAAKWFSYTHLHESILFKILFAYRLLKVLSRVPCATQFSSVQLLSHVQLFATPWTAACQASLSITKSQSLLKLISIKLVMPSNHLILCHPLLLLPSIFPNIRIFPKESVLLIRWPKYWSFSFNISPSNEYSGLISFRIDWFDLAVQGTLKSLLQYHNSKALILQLSTLWSNSHIHTWLLEKP